MVVPLPGTNETLEDILPHSSSRSLASPGAGLEPRLPDAQVTLVATSPSCAGPRHTRHLRWLLTFFSPHLVSTVKVYLHFQLDEIIYTLEALPLILVL